MTHNLRLIKKWTRALTCLSSQLFGVFVILSLLVCPSAQAGGTDLVISYQKARTEYMALKERLPVSLRKRFEPSGQHGKAKLKSEQIELKRQYLELKNRYETLKLSLELKEALLQTFADHNPQGNTPAVDQEAEQLALALIPEIARLKASYHYIGSPILHNMLINSGMRERGACKDWAEDLLSFLQKRPHRYFRFTWGEANATKLTEHNVTVIIPLNGQFEDGLLIDPWRKRGNPFWIQVKADKHYKWRKWDGYEGD